MSFIHSTLISHSSTMQRLMLQHRRLLLIRPDLHTNFSTSNYKKNKQLLQKNILLLGGMVVNVFNPSRGRLVKQNILQVLLKSRGHKKKQDKTLRGQSRTEGHLINQEPPLQLSRVRQHYKFLRICKTGRLQYQFSQQFHSLWYSTQCYHPGS